MSGPICKMSKVARSLWETVAGPQEDFASQHPKVIVHDPEASLPHDLDDPFFDRSAQARMADLIAHARRKHGVDR